MQRRRPVMLVILDGWGWREETADNAVRQAKTPTFDRLWSTGPHAFLRTSGLDVGLPEGQMGNSEVGHLTIGAGRVIMQDLPRISDAIAKARTSGRSRRWATLHGQRCKKSGGICHLVGPRAAGRRALASGPRRRAGEHSRGRRRADPPVHALTDGRDTPPRAANEDI